MFVPPSQRFLVTFSPAVTRLPALYFAQYTKIIQKKRKSPEPSSPPAAPLSSEQLERIARNKRAALAKLTSAQTPPGFGKGWEDKLSAEFGKPYFKQVRQVPLPISVSLTILINLVSATADEIRCWRAEVPHCLPTCRSGVRLDTDVWHQRCKFTRPGKSGNTHCHQKCQTKWRSPQWKT